MKKIITIHQPDFCPWLGFFDRWAKSDLFIILDDVQFLRRGWHHRDRIITAHGIQWLTVPVIKKGRYEQRIMDVVIDNQSTWHKKHIKTISAAYKKAPFFTYVFNNLCKVYMQGHKKLIELNMDFLKTCADMLGITTPFVLASSLGVNKKSNERLIHLIQAVGGDTYLSGTGARDYLNETTFTRNNVQVLWQKYKHPVYLQLHKGFQEKLSIIDFLMMNLPEKHGYWHASNSKQIQQPDRYGNYNKRA